MNTRTNLFALSIAALAAASPAVAQNGGTAAAGGSATAEAAKAETAVLGPRGVQGLNRFEAPKNLAPFEGVRITLGGSFAMNFQALSHSNAADEVLVNGANVNQLAAIRPGINLPSANLDLGVHLAPGISMVLESYMSSRHHNEFWVKGGYATIDASPIDVPVLNSIMQHTTIRAGMYEPNYGDALFRRSDNGNAMRNPFVENYLLDAFTTEPGFDVMVRAGDVFAMVGATTGQNKGDIADGAVDAAPALLAKVGFDRQMSDDLRVRLSGSVYSASESPRTTLYSGDRTGSNYWGVIDNATAGSFTNGRLSAAFPNELTAVQINPFVKLGGLELFGVIERATGKALAEAESREVNQYAGDVVYRLFDDQLYVGGRYNVVRGDLSAAAVDDDVTVDRTALSAGWFIAPNMLAKVEWVQQGFDGFASTDIRHGAKFDGVVLQGAISF